MKKLFWIGLTTAYVVISSTPTIETGTLIGGRCSICVRQGLVSTVTCDGFSSCTAMYCGSGIYDEQGNFHPPDPCNSCITLCHCSNGHTIYRTDSLAPRPLFFHDPESIEEWVKQYQDLKEFIHRIHPGADVMVTRIDNPPSDPHWFKLPFTWKEMSVWVKYHHIYDMGRAA